MKIITICNYPNEVEWNALCLWWLDNALVNSQLDIEIWYEHSIQNPLLLNINNDRVKYVQKAQVKTHGLNNWNIDNPKAQHNICFKMYNLCMEPEPYIFLDMDAILLKNIQPLLDAAPDKPVIMIDHQWIQGHTAGLPRPYKHNYLNSGVQIVSDPKLMNFDLIIKHQNKRSDLLVSGYDQAMIFNYFVNIQYNYTHPMVDFTWNNAAGLSTPLQYVNINHYWMDFKPWNIRCPLWEAYIKKIKECK